jgi:hypothetical protein
VTARACKGSVVLERGFQDAVVDLARLNGGEPRISGRR